MRGSVTRLVKKQQCGFVLGEDGCEVYFDQRSLEGVEIHSLSVGEWVDYEVQFWGDRLHAAGLKPILRARVQHR